MAYPMNNRGPPPRGQPIYQSRSPPQQSFAPPPRQHYDQQYQHPNGYDSGYDDQRAQDGYDQGSYSPYPDSGYGSGPRDPNPPKGQVQPPQAYRPSHQDEYRSSSSRAGQMRPPPHQPNYGPPAGRPSGEYPRRISRSPEGRRAMAPPTNGYRGTAPALMPMNGRGPPVLKQSISYPSQPSSDPGRHGPGPISDEYRTVNSMGGRTGHMGARPDPRQYPPQQPAHQMQPRGPPSQPPIQYNGDHRQPPDQYQSSGLRPDPRRMAPAPGSMNDAYPDANLDQAYPEHDPYNQAQNRPLPSNPESYNHHRGRDDPPAQSFSRPRPGPGPGIPSQLSQAPFAYDRTPANLAPAPAWNTGDQNPYDVLPEPRRMGDVRTGYQGDRDSIGTFLDEYYVPNSEHEPMPPTHGFDFSDQDHGGSATGGPHINGRFIHETGQLENQMNNVSLTSSPQPIQAGGRPPYPDGPSGSNPEMRPRPGVRPGLPTGRPPLGSNPPSQSSRSQSRGDPGIATGPQPIPEPPASARPVLPVNKAHSATSTKSPPAKHYDEAGKILATLPIPPPPEKTSVGAKDGSGKSKPEKVTAEILSALRVKAQSAPSNMQLQIDLAKRIAEAAEGGVVGGATPKIVEANKKRYRDESLNIMKKAAIAGNPEAMFFIADNHSAGTCGLELSPEKAFPMYEKAAMKGHVPAMFRTAVSYEIGLEGGGGTQHSIPKAMEWYNRSAQGGDTASMYKLGVIQLKGLLGQPRSFRDATQWLNRAAEQADEDNPHALHELALLHMAPPPNTGFPRDYARSTDLLHRAAELGYKFSQFRLGQAYEHGQLGLPVDPQQSIKWYSAAAAQEEHQSELAISGWYLTGAPDGILDQNDTEAFLWAMKAAGGDLDVQQQNDAEGRRPLPKAEFAMGYFCEVGIGREKDVARAWEWYVRAARNGDPRARGRLDEMERANRGVYGPGGQGDVGQRKRSREGEWFQGSQ